MKKRKEVVKQPIHASYATEFCRRVNLNTVMDYITENGLILDNLSLSDSHFHIEISIKWPPGLGTWKDANRDITYFEKFILDLEDEFLEFNSSEMNSNMIKDMALAIVGSRKCHI